jgi:hypothetical protein
MGNLSALHVRELNTSDGCAEVGREVFARFENIACGLKEAFSLVGLVGKTFRFACKETPRKQRMSFPSVCNVFCGSFPGCERFQTGLT